MRPDPSSRIRRRLATAVVLFLGLAFAPRIHAQGPGGFGGAGRDPQAMMQQRVQMLTERLQLTPEQVERLRPVLQKQAEKMREIMESSNGDFQSARPQMQSLREKTDKEIAGILTDEQRARYKTMQEEMRTRRGGGRQR